MRPVHPGAAVQGERIGDGLAAEQAPATQRRRLSQAHAVVIRREQTEAQHQRGMLLIECERKKPARRQGAIREMRRVPVDPEIAERQNQPPALAHRIRHLLVAMHGEFGPFGHACLENGPLKQRLAGPAVRDGKATAREIEFHRNEPVGQHRPAHVLFHTHRSGAKALRKTGQGHQGEQGGQHAEGRGSERPGHLSSRRGR